MLSFYLLQLLFIFVRQVVCWTWQWTDPSCRYALAFVVVSIDDPGFVCACIFFLIERHVKSQVVFLTFWLGLVLQDLYLGP